MGAELGADATVFADQGSGIFLVEVKGADDTGFLATAAPDAFFDDQLDATTGPFLQGTGWTGLGTGPLVATGQADDTDHAPGHTAGGFYLDPALGNTMVLFVDCRTGDHAGKTTDAFVHAIGAQHFGHRHTSMGIHPLNCGSV